MYYFNLIILIAHSQYLLAYTSPQVNPPSVLHILLNIFHRWSFKTCFHTSAEKSSLPNCHMRYSLNVLNQEWFFVLETSHIKDSKLMRCINSSVTICVSLNHHDKILQNRWVKQQIYIFFHSSGGWKVQAPGPVGFSFWCKVSCSFADGHLLLMFSQGRERKE